MRQTASIVLAGLLFLLPCVATAQTVTLQVSPQAIDVNETVRATIEIGWTTGNGTVNLDGIQDFEILSSSTSNALQVVNGQREQTTTMILDLQPQESGEYTIGPARLTIQGEGVVASSQEVTIEVTGEKLFVWAVPRGWTVNGDTLVAQPDKVQWISAFSPMNEPRELPWRVWRVVSIVVIVRFWVRKLQNRQWWVSSSKKSDTVQPVFEPKRVNHSYNTDDFIPQSSPTMSKPVSQYAETLHAVIDEVGQVVVGQQRLIRNLLIALIAQGHILLEWVPGLAKTLSVESLAKVIGVAFGRVQFTPDLLPSDLTGTKVFDQSKTEFVTKKWPIFTNLLLADEINRAPAKVQSALLEAMAEMQVTIGDERLALDSPFVVMATQNPLEQEGTYSLPEAQLDRFLLKTVIGYPTQEEEIQIMKQETGVDTKKLQKLLTKNAIKEIQAATTAVSVADGIYTYVKNIVVATREPAENNCWDIAQYIQYGVSPRASLAMIKSAKVLALLAWREYVLPEDIKEIAHDVLRHRIIVSYQAIADGREVDQLIDTILDRVPVVA